MIYLPAKMSCGAKYIECEKRIDYSNISYKINELFSMIYRRGKM